MSDRIKLHDRLRGGVLERLSDLTVIFPVLRRIPEPKIAHVPLHWLHPGIPSSWLPNTVNVPGVGRKAGYTPKNYPEAAIISLPKENIDELRRRQDDCHAVVYALGSTVMVGIQVMPDKDPFGLSDDGKRYLVAMGIGRGPLVATGGIWRLEPGHLSIPEDPVVLEGRVPVNQIPEGVPLV